MSNETWWEELTKSTSTLDNIAPRKRSDFETTFIGAFFVKIGRPDIAIPDDVNVIPSIDVNGRTFNVEFDGENRVIISLITDFIDPDDNGYYIAPHASFVKEEFVQGVQKLLNMEETNKTRVKVQQEQKAAIEAFNAARHPYVTYEYLEEKDFTNVIEMGKLGFRVISTYLVRGASEKEPRWLMERCSNNIQHKNPDGEETLPF